MKTKNESIGILSMGQLENLTKKQLVDAIDLFSGRSAGTSDLTKISKHDAIKRVKKFLMSKPDWRVEVICGDVYLF